MLAVLVHAHREATKTHTNRHADKFRAGRKLLRRQTMSSIGLAARQIDREDTTTAGEIANLKLAAAGFDAPLAD